MFSPLSRIIPLAIVLALLTACAASGALEILNASYQPDRMFPEWNYFYSSSYKPGDVVPDRVQGGHIYVYLYNSGTTSVTVSDFTINGMALTAGLRSKTDKVYRCDLYASSVYYPYVHQTLVDAGIPVWWRVEPSSIPAGGVGEVVVRMRRTIPQTLSCAIVPSSGGSIACSIPVSGADAARITDYFYSPGTNKLYLYLLHPQKGKIPTAVYVDQNNVTSNCTFAADPDVDIVTVRVNMTSSLSRGTYHVFKAAYDDGTAAAFGLRVYSDNFKISTWNAPDLANETEQHDFLVDLVNHSVNLLTMGTGALSDYLKSSAGKAIMDANGIKKSVDDKTADRLYSIFVCDEPDCAEGNVPDSVAPGDKTGVLGQCMIYQIRDSFRGSYSIYPTIVNIDGSSPPYHWYNWGQVADMFCHDGYFMVRLRDAYELQPARVPFFSKFTWRYASARTAKAACEPKREHIINDCNRAQRDTDVFRWPTPDQQRIICYYSVAAGAKELGWWWLTELSNSTVGSNGLADQPGSIAMWREMGLVGAELSMIGDLIVNSTPADIPVTAPGRLWVRSLVSGVDTIVLMCVNDDYTCDVAGTTLRPINNAYLKLDLPGWLANPTDVFEVDYRGVRDVPKTIADGQVTMNLGRVDVTRLLIVTKDTTLKTTLQGLYTNTYGPRVAALTPLP